MAKYIECEAAYRFAQDQLKKETGAYSRGWNHAMNVIKSALHNNDAIPAADVVSRDCYDRLLAENDELRKERPVVRCGEWVEENTRPRSSQFYCSVCHRTAYDPQPTRSVGWVKRCRYHYCPNCGARMDGDGE